MKCIHYYKNQNCVVLTNCIIEVYWLVLTNYNRWSMMKLQPISKTNYNSSPCSRTAMLLKWEPPPLCSVPSPGAGRSSEVERSLMVRWVVGSILHDWCNKGCGMYYPVCGMVHIKEPLLLIDKSSLCGGSGFPFSLSEWSLTICLTPYNRR